MNVKPITWHPRKTYIFVFESWNWISTAASLSRSPVEPKVSKWSLQSKDFVQWEIFPPFHSKSFLKFFCFLSCAFSFSVFWAVFILFLFLTQINFNLLSSKTSREFCLADLARNREKYTSSLISGNKLSILKLDLSLTLSSSNKLNKAELTVTPIADTPTITPTKTSLFLGTFIFFKIYYFDFCVTLYKLRKLLLHIFCYGQSRFSPSEPDTWRHFCTVECTWK